MKNIVIDMIAVATVMRNIRQSFALIYYLSIAKTIRHNKYILIARTNENKIKCFSPFRSTLSHMEMNTLIFILLQSVE
mgnify:FL=1